MVGDVAARSLDLVVAALLPAPNDATSGRLARVAAFSPRPRSSPPRGGGHRASGLPCASRRDAGPAPSRRHRAESRRLLALFPAAVPRAGGRRLACTRAGPRRPCAGSHRATAASSRRRGLLPPPLAVGGCCRLLFARAPARLLAGRRQGIGCKGRGPTNGGARVSHFHGGIDWVRQRGDILGRTQVDKWTCKWMPPLCKWETSPPSDHWAPRASGPLVSGL
jgi:hypothetical protein